MTTGSMRWCGRSPNCAACPAEAIPLSGSPNAPSAPGGIPAPGRHLAAVPDPEPDELTAVCAAAELADTSGLGEGRCIGCGRHGPYGARSQLGLYCGCYRQATGTEGVTAGSLDGYAAMLKGGRGAV